MSNKFKDPEFMSQFIDKYREMRNLWEVKNSAYYNKPIRKATLKRLLAFVQTLIPEATLGILEPKIGILGNMYRRENNKIQASLRSGASADDVYVPKLWYYNKLSFLDDQTEARESLSTLPSTLPCSLPSTLPSTPAEADKEQPGPSILEEPDVSSWSQDELSQEEVLESGRQEEAGPSDSQGVAMPSDSQEVAGPSVSQEAGGPSVSQEVAGPSRSLTQSQVPPLRLHTKRPRKGTVTEEASLRLIREATNVLTSPPDAEEAYGFYIASRLVELEKGQCLLCERIIFDALHKELRGELTANSQIYEQAHPPPPPPPLPPPPSPATSPPPEPQPPRKGCREGCRAAWREGCNYILFCSV
ncbi:hypothetical protein AB205_0097260, partial [Aquarana catesbeiana]